MLMHGKPGLISCMDWPTGRGTLSPRWRDLCDWLKIVARTLVYRWVRASSGARVLAV